MLHFLLMVLGWFGYGGEVQNTVPVEPFVLSGYMCIRTGEIVSEKNTWVRLQETPYDFLSDDSIYKYVNPSVGLNELNYTPPDLVGLEDIEFVELRNNQGELRQEAASALAELAKAFHQEFGRSLVLVSSYRSYSYQKKLLEGYIAQMGTGKANSLSAMPGHSEHQLGLAIDVFNASTNAEVGYKNYFSWLRAHAHKYGWTQSYQKGLAIDGYVREPWHWRYVGVKLATDLWEKKITYAEYINQ